MKDLKLALKELSDNFEQLGDEFTKVAGCKVERFGNFSVLDDSIIYQTYAVYDIIDDPYRFELEVDPEHKEYTLHVRPTEMSLNQTVRIKEYIEKLNEEFNKLD